MFKSIIKCLHHDCVFTRNNKHIRHIKKALERGCSEAELQDIIFQDFGHTFVTRKRIKEHNPVKIMKVTGHKDVSMYLRYNTVTEKELKT